MHGKNELEERQTSKLLIFLKLVIPTILPASLRAHPCCCAVALRTPTAAASHDGKTTVHLSSKVFGVVHW